MTALFALALFALVVLIGLGVISAGHKHAARGDVMREMRVRSIQQQI